MSNLKAIQAGVEGFMTGDLAPMMSILEEDVTMRLTVADGTPLSGVFQGKEGVLRYLGLNAETVRADSMEVVNYLEGGNQVAVVGRETLTVVRSGRVMKNADWVMLFTFRGDRVKKIVIIEDTHEIATSF